MCCVQDESMERAMRANIIKVGGKPYTTYTYQDSNAEHPSVDLTPTPDRPFPRFSKQPKPFLPVDPGTGTWRMRAQLLATAGAIATRIKLVC